MMDILIAAVLGLVQGLTEFLPVSSSGHLVILERLTGTAFPALTFHVFLHAGTSLAVLAAFRKDFRRLFLEGSAATSKAARRTRGKLGRGKESPARERISLSGQKGLLRFVLLVSVVTAAVGAALYPVADAAVHSALYTGIGFLATGVMMLIAGMVEPGSETARDLSDARCAVIGIFQGVSVLPGFSRAAFTVSAGIFSGMSRKTAIRLSYLVSVPCVFGALIFQIIAGVQAGIFTWPFLAVCLTGMGVSAVTGFFMIGRCLVYLKNHSLNRFSYYCFAAGLIAIVIHFAG